MPVNVCITTPILNLFKGGVKIFYFTAPSKPHSRLWFNGIQSYTLPVLQTNMEKSVLVSLKYVMFSYDINLSSYKSKFSYLMNKLIFIFVQILNLFVGVLNFIITDTMFHGRFASYGTDIISVSSFYCLEFSGHVKETKLRVSPHLHCSF